MVDALVLTALAAAGVGIALWVVTNLHLRWAKNQLQRYGTDARQRTEAFVARELQTLEVKARTNTESLTERIADLKTGLPTDVTDRLDALDTRCEGLVGDLKARFAELGQAYETLPTRIRQSFGGVAGQEALAQDKDIRAVTEEFKAMAVQDLDPQQVMHRQLIEWMNRPVSKKASPAEEAITLLAKRAAAQLLLQGQQEPNTVTYTVQSPRRGGNMEM